MAEQRPGYLAKTWPLGLAVVALFMCGRSCGRGRGLGSATVERPTAAARIPESPGPASEPPRCELHLDGTPVVPVFPTEDGLDEWFRGAAQNVGSDALATIRRANGGLLAETGTRCAYIDRGFQKSKIRILSGPHEGKAGWIYTDWARK